MICTKIGEIFLLRMLTLVSRLLLSDSSLYPAVFLQKRLNKQMRNPPNSLLRLPRIRLYWLCVCSEYNNCAEFQFYCWFKVMTRSFKENRVPSKLDAHHYIWGSGEWAFTEIHLKAKKKLMRIGVKNYMIYTLNFVNKIKGNL
mgnify:CR=1 FL=1